MLLTLSENARKELEGYFEGKTREKIRVFLTGGCGGPRLAIALDNMNDDDLHCEEGGFTFMINKELYDEVGDINVDCDKWGFNLTSAKPLPQSEGGGCGSCCASSAGGCGSGCGGAY